MIKRINKDPDRLKRVLRRYGKISGAALMAMVPLLFFVLASIAGNQFDRDLKHDRLHPVLVQP